MDIAFCGLINQSNVVVYLDDVTIYLKKMEDDVHHLKQIFERWKKDSISLNLKKNIFVVSKGELMGHIISKDEIIMNTKEPRLLHKSQFQ